MSLPPAVADAIDALPADGPALVYDRAAIAARIAAVAAAGRAAGVRVLMAMKSFPHDEVIDLAADALDGFDAGSRDELVRLGARGAGRIVSVTDPTGAPVVGPAGAELVITVETPAQAAAAHPRARLAVRLAASHLLAGPDAIGGVLEDTGARTSRFGLRFGEPDWRAQVAAIAAAAPGRVVGVHVHHGGIAATSAARLVALATAALAAADDAGLALSWLDLGGGLHALIDLPGALAAVRAAVPSGIEIAIEPGRLLALDGGYAVAHVRAARELEARSLRVVDLSRACHLRWQRVHPVGGWRPDGDRWRAMRGVLPARTGEARRTLFAGPTCYEEDVIGEWKLGRDADDGARWPEGSRLVLAGVDGYALAWNSGFGGVPPARVVVV